MRDAFDIMTEEDLTPDLQMLSDICGMDTVRLMLRNFSGLSFYIPKISRLDSLVIKYAKENPAKSFKQIAKDLNVSLQFLNKILKENRAN